MSGGSRAEDASSTAWLAVAALAVAAGAYLRAQQLAAQVVLDDEWHALHKALAASGGEIATSFGHADHSIPIALWIRWLLEHGGLTELGLRAPMLAAGLLTLAAVPWLMRDRAGLATRVALVVLLAISPLLVLYSRFARPYALTCPLVFFALVAFDRWWARVPHARRWAWGYLLATAAAGWLSPVTLPFTLAPFAYRGIGTLVALAHDGGAVARKRLWRLAKLSVETLLPLALLLGPPLAADWSALAAKAGAEWVTLRAGGRALLLLLGTGTWWIGAPMLALAALGIARLARDDRDQLAYFAGVCAIAFVVIVAARPEWIRHPPVLARYLLPMLPLLLVAIACGAVLLLEAVTRARAVAPVAIASLGALLWLAGPLPPLQTQPTQFSAHLRFWFDFDPARNPYLTLQSLEPVPRFYRELAALPPGSRTLIEAPWRLESHYNPLARYQQVHRQRVRVGLVSPVCGTRAYGEYAEDASLRLRNFVHLSALLRGERFGADYLVMHLAPVTTPPGAPIEWPDVAACLPTIARVLGDPVYTDARIVVYALKRERTASR